MPEESLSHESETEAAFSEGQSVTAALEQLKAKLVNGETVVDDYLITVLAGKAEGWYESGENGTLVWREPAANENAHLAVVVQDRRDLRFIPFLGVECSLFDSGGELIGKLTHPFTWHPLLYHYGANWHVSAEDDYIVEVAVRKPAFARHDQDFGQRYLYDVAVKLDFIHIVPGQQKG